MDEKLKEYNPDLSPYSLRTYKSLFNTVVKNTAEFSENAKWFKDNKAAIINYIDGLNSSHSKKTKLAAVIVMAKAYKVPETDLTPFIDIVNKLADEISTRNKTHTMTDKMRDNWLTIEELKQILEKIKRKLIKVTDVDNYSEYATWIRYFILLMVVNGFARRNEWVNMKLLKVQTLEQPEDKQHNYIIYNVKKNKINAKIFFNVYKTASTYGAKVFDITNPDILRLIPKVDLLINKFSENNFLVVKQDKKPITTDHFSNWLNIATRQYANGKELNTTLLRHIVASSLYTAEDIKKQEEREKEADIMGHSLEQSFNTYVKKS